MGKKVENKKKRGVPLKLLVLAAFCVAVLAAGFIIGLLTMPIIPVKADDPAQDIYIRSPEDFARYSQEYAEGNHNPADRLIISFDSGSAAVITNSDFVSLGTYNRPFAGVLWLPNAGNDVFELYECPIFDYVTTDFSLESAGGQVFKITRGQLPADASSNDVLTEGALFANHVIQGSSPTLNISIINYPFSQFNDGTDGSAADVDHKGLIGDIEDGCTVSVVFDNKTDMSVVSDADAGLICGNLGEGSTLNVTFSTLDAGVVSSSNNISVSTNSGDAGGLVGKMQENSVLNIYSENLSRIDSVSVTGGSGYAGGIVGKVDTASVNVDSSVSSYTVEGTVSGQQGAGGLYGYYNDSTASPVTFTLDKLTPETGLVVESNASNGYTGGLFGYFENNAESFTFDGSKDQSKVINANLNSGMYRGGICGYYKTDLLTNTLDISNTGVSVHTTEPRINFSGGLIGQIDSESPAYVSISDVEVQSRGSGGSDGLSGGLIGNAAATTTGSFVDVTGDVVISGKCDAGLVSQFNSGVLRLDGLTDISGMVTYDTSSAKLVKDRVNTLIYALGDGETSGGWQYYRNNSRLDDIGSWGEVIRVDGTTLSESNLFTVNMTDHTVTVLAGNASMGNVTTFAKTALNIKLNTDGDVGALKFADTHNSAYYLNNNLSLTGDIDLTGTGILGLTRDNGSNNAFTKTFNGNNHTITFATGEVYGLGAGGAALDANTAQGYICRHLYNGLFAKASSSATVKNLKIDGNVNLYPSVANYRYGGVIGYAGGTVTLDNVASNQNIIVRNGSNVRTLIGAYIGEAGGGSLNLTATNLGDSSVPAYLPTFTDYTDSAIEGGTGTMTYVGGVIGFVSDGSNQVVSITDSTIGLNYSKNAFATEPLNTNRVSAFGGAIAGIGNTDNAYNIGKRRVTIDGCNVYVDATGVAANNKFGGILGTDWYDSDVTISDITVNADIESTAGKAYYGGLVQTATGYWDLQSIDLDNVQYTLYPSGESTFGFVTNKCTKPGGSQSALYLDLYNDDYNIGNLTFTNDPGFAVFDEVVADSRTRNISDLAANGNSIISITTNETDGTIGSTSDTYVNKTVYGAAHTKNPYTRYYYNIKYAREHYSTEKFKFLDWSVWTYAHTSLSSWFPNNTTFTDVLDMTGLSYYPVNLRGNVTFNNAILKFDNVEMESRVYTTNRSTRKGGNSSGSHHYMMHTGAILNDSGYSINVTGGTGLVLQGNVARISDNHCGFLVANTITGTDDRRADFNASKILFDGAHIVTNTGADLTNNTYAPLLINKIGRKTTLKINAAEQSTTAYSSYNSKYAASSLIGNVGDDTASSIYLTFRNLVFDARESNIIPALDSFYGTGRSIFSRATILNSFIYAGDSSGSYNYNVEEDWGNDPTSPVATHKVAYGREVTASVEFPNEEDQYYSSEYFTTPVLPLGNSTPYSTFAAGWRPYVYESYDPSENKHELSVNVSINAEIEGCGKYDDPYIIDSGDKLDIISRIIAGDLSQIADSQKIYLPDDFSDSGQISYTGVLNTNYHKYEYQFTSDVLSGTSTSVTSNNGGASKQLSLVREYLAGAYFKVTTGISVPYNYTPLGAPTGSDDLQKYAFRGVITGPSSGATITNHSGKPLIYTSNGCVVKNINLTVDPRDNEGGAATIGIYENQAVNTAVYKYFNGNDFYGAVIGQVLGGDSFIDNVDVSFNNVTFDFLKTSGKTTYARLTPVGGYVGVIVNGGLVFRNMTSSNLGLQTADFKVSGSSVGDLVPDDGYLYINPIIGRVIAGYAFNEADTYHATETDTTLKNSLDGVIKNYSISDLVVPSSVSDKLKVTYKSSKFTVEVPNGQSMYVLGAIINSGAASAVVNTGTDNDYQALEASAFWQAYRGYTVSRAGSNYTTVGTSSGPDYTTACGDDGLNSLKKIPYIIRAYTASFEGSTEKTSRYYARSITTRNDNLVYITGDCNVPAGFRGIGSIYYYSYNGYLNLKAQKFMGSTSSGTATQRNITLNMRYIEYDHYTVKSYLAAPSSDVKFEGTTDTSRHSAIAGYGLLNYALINNGTANETNSINSLSLNGNVFYDILHVTDGQQSKYILDHEANDSVDGVGFDTVLSVGGVVGHGNGRRLYFKNINVDGLTVEGPRYVGGVLGFTGDLANNFIYIKNCGTSISGSGTDSSVNGVTVKGGVSAGGLVGYALCKVQMNGDAKRTFILVNEIYVKCVDTDQSNNRTTSDGYASSNIDSLKWLATDFAYGAGGLIGIFQPRGLGSTINSYTITGKTGNDNHIYGSQVYTVSKKDYTHAGGIVGFTKNRNITFTDITIDNINLLATFSGGIVGAGYSNKEKKTSGSEHLNFNYTNVKFTGASSDNKSVIKGYLYAGGFVGKTVIEKSGNNGWVEINIDDCSLENYSIVSASSMLNNSISGAAGGLVGYTNPSVSKPQTFSSKIHNLLIDGCSIYNEYPGTKNDSGTGGLFGTLNRSLIQGYNIMLRDTLINAQTVNSRVSALVGNNYDGYTDVKLVGVSVNLASGTPIAIIQRNVGNKSNAAGEKYGPAGYIIFSDYAGLMSENAFPALGSYSNVTVKSPFASVNPSASVYGLTASALTLTGDGVASTIAGLPINTILSDPDNKYIYSKSAAYSSSVSTSNADAFRNYLGQFAMYKDEVTYPGQNFPILVLESLDRNESHKIINSYLRLLTNTQYDYGLKTNTDIYDFSIYNMKYDSTQGKFVKDSSSASLRWYNNQFYMVYSAVDSGGDKIQFSLLDVAFKDPNDPSTVAYHLYVPVFVKKVLSYRFEIGALSGTDYYKDNYLAVLGDPVIENFGTPITMHFSYTYSRTPAEWTDAINGGESVERNYNKQLLITKASNSSYLKYLPGDTVLVLVDPADGGKAYYSTVALALGYPSSDLAAIEAANKTTLNLSAFKSEMSVVSPGVYSFGGDSFVPKNFDEMLDITVSADPDGTLVVAGSGETATVTYNGVGYRPAEESDTGTKYKATVAGDEAYRLVEEYYLSVMTDGDESYDKFHYFVVTAPSTFGDATYQSKMEDTGRTSMFHYRTGRIFDHSGFVISSDSENHSDVMSASNNELNVSMSVDLSLATAALGPELKSDMMNFITSVNVYQSYLVYLTRTEAGLASRAILGNPTATVTSYSVSIAGSSFPYADSQIIKDVRQSHAEFTSPSLSHYFASGNTFTISATVNLSYTDSAIPTQFPGRNELIYPDDGVTVSGASNVAFDQSNIAYSKNSITADGTPRRVYYSEKDPEYALLYLNPIGDRVGDYTPLGINALNLSNPSGTSSDFDLLAVLDISSIVDDVAAYTHADISIKLSQRQNTGSYGPYLDISDYLTVDYEGDPDASTNVTFADNSFNMTLERALLQESGVEITMPIFHFTVETGSPFEAKNHIYGNYRVEMNVCLKDTNGVVYKFSRAANFVIYTNAKIIPDFIVSSGVSEP